MTAKYLAAQATARPWTSLFEGIVGADEDAINEADAALIVYAVNHIEQVEAERDTAVALLTDGQTRLARYIPEDGDVEWSQAVRDFLAKRDGGGA